MWLEKWNVRYARFGNPPVYDRRLFPWIAELEDAYPAIRAELDNLLSRRADLPSFDDVVPIVANITRDDRWKTFLFAGYGARSRRNIRRCPKTWAALQRIPGLQTAMFSIFEPGKHVRPHRGPYNGVLRAHLGLIVPEDREATAIRVADTVYHWREGEAVVFDDSFEHEAWNHSNDVRVVLFVDFRRPLRFPYALVNWLVLRLTVFTPIVREARRAESRWEQRFYGGQPGSDPPGAGRG